MDKLMNIDPYNRAMPRKIIGQDMFGDTYPTCSTTCQKQTDCDDCPIQEAFARLRQYEQTDLDPEQIMELKEQEEFFRGGAVWYAILLHSLPE